jgi:hypothetical protein
LLWDELIGQDYGQHPGKMFPFVEFINYLNSSGIVGI